MSILIYDVITSDVVTIQKKISHINSSFPSSSSKYSTQSDGHFSTPAHIRKKLILSKILASKFLLKTLFAQVEKSDKMHH